MPRLDPNPLPYGGLQYFQAHYILELDGLQNQTFLARCEPITRGHFANKRVVDVRWTGTGKFAERLQNDTKLTELLKKVLVNQGEIRVDPQDDHIRIYGKWIHEDRFAFNETMLEIADRIAMHIKKKPFEINETD